MRLRILAIGNKMPAWVTLGFQEYAKRFPASCPLELCEIAAEKRTPHSDLPRLVEKEGDKLLSIVKSTHRIIALDVNGKSPSTEALAVQMAEWQREGKNIDFLIGGPDGLSEACLKQANNLWSLSPLTLPHPLVRIVLTEQLYRALMILQGHPYHR